MILSDNDISKLIEEKKIKIVPYDNSHVYPASYTFSLGSNLLHPIGDDLIDFTKGLLPEYQEIVMDENGYRLESGEFILGQTLEKMTLCDEIAMMIEGRSSLARAGISVTQTASFIEPNHTDSIITLEIKNVGKSPFMLYPGMKIAKGIFFKLSSPASQKFNKGTYITQNETTPPHIKEYQNLKK